MKWRNDQNKSRRSWWVIQLLYSSPLQLKSFSVWKSGLKLLFSEISNLNCSKLVTKLVCWFGHSFHLTKFEHFKFSNLKKWQVWTRFSTIKWFQLTKWWIPKLYNSSRSPTFILVISSFHKVLSDFIKF